MATQDLWSTTCVHHFGFNEHFLAACYVPPNNRGAAMATQYNDDQKWEALAAKYLRRLAAEDMREWARYWRFEERSNGPALEQHGQNKRTEKIYGFWR